MADLLSNSERAEARTAFRDIADTFYKTPITYKLFSASLDRFNEDRQDDIFVTHNLLGFLEYSSVQDDRIVYLTTGANESKAAIRITFNNDILDGLGLWNATLNLPKFNQATDKLFVRGREYVITLIALDGPLEDKNVLTYIFAEPKPQQTT